MFRRVSCLVIATVLFIFLPGTLLAAARRETYREYVYVPSLVSFRCGIDGRETSFFCCVGHQVVCLIKVSARTTHAASTRAGSEQLKKKLRHSRMGRVYNKWLVGSRSRESRKTILHFLIYWWLYLYSQKNLCVYFLVFIIKLTFLPATAARFAAPCNCLSRPTEILYCTYDASCGVASCRYGGSPRCAEL